MTSSMNRTRARELWRRVADGDLEVEQYDGVDLHAWIRSVAAQVLEADSEASATKRRASLISAIALDGRLDQYAALRDLISEPFWEFPTLDPATGQAREDTLAELVRAVVLEAEKRNLLRGTYAEDPKKAQDLIRELLKEHRNHGAKGR